MAKSDLPPLPSQRLSILALLLALLSTAAAPAAESAAIQVEPIHVVLSGAQDRQQVAVTVSEPDGSVRCVTSVARFTIEPPEIAQVSVDGVLTPQEDGQAILTVEAEGRSVRIPVLVEKTTLSRPVSYRLDIVPLLSKAGCNQGTCHGNLNGKGGFKLSLRGDNPSFDLASLTRDAFGRRINRQAPEASLILLKPTGARPHEGGLRFSADSIETRLLHGWIAAGAIDDKSEAPKLTRLTVFPAERIAAYPARSQQLVVTAEFDDGTTRDVTRQASYDLSEPTAYQVTPDGRVVAEGPGEVTVAVRYLQGRAISRLAFLPDRPNFVWRDVPENNTIDRHVFAKLRSLKIQPSDLASDPVFLRRVYLDTIGRLPTPDETRAFLAETDTQKRNRLIDTLVARPEFADFWALKWADLLRNEEKTMGAKGVWVFQRWLRDQIAADVPLDAFARQVVSSTGSTWENPPASFYRTNRDPQTCAETIGQVFLGVRLQCARCHNHPFDVWTQDDYYGLAAYFGNLERKQINNQRRDRFDKHEINGDEVIYLSGLPQMVQPRSGEMMQPKPPGGPAPSLDDDRDALDDLASWITRDNAQFARNMANRVWFHLLGRGIVDPVDDFRDSNPPSNPALLDALTDAFRGEGMRLRPLVALILKSRTYQLSATPNETNAEDVINFARARVRLLPAEVLLDSIGQAVGAPARFKDSPGSLRAIQLPGAKMGGEFLKVFGKPDRLLTCECERSEETTLAQAFQLINGEDVREMLESGENRIGRLLNAGASDEAILEEIYLASLCRRPTEIEHRAAIDHVARESDPRKAWEDIVWAVVNSKEFLLRH